ncbi:MAG: tRNA (N(6)-L-threonylcarbamoyladenosine(37)-C(2))-methylthiotransferase MtaB [Rhodospirillales bacterium]|nr:tRNA (N(6)-L-threonylcarbamoyladenosine(37)-C(2))-methylthiotransferase MtaB [Rhodospirillales bacterium]
MSAATEPRVVTFGCRLNALESEVIRVNARTAGLENTIVVNTCTVTAEATRQARQAVRRLRRENPSARLIVTGCAAQMEAERFASMTEVDHVLDNAAKLDPARYVPEALARGAGTIEAGPDRDARPSFPWSGPAALGGPEGRARATLQVQQGCDHRCTFCIIPFARGPNRSVPISSAVRRARELCQAGYREIVLSGVDLCSYGADLAGRPTLATLVRRLLTQVPALARLRLSSLDPGRVPDALIALLGEDVRLMPHLHLSLQSLDPLILKRMKRRHAPDDVHALCARARAVRPDVAFGADLIAGFPTETETQFARTLDGVAELGLAYLHVFPYSPRPDTPAARMPQLPVGVRKARAARLRAAGDRGFLAHLGTKLGTSAAVLVETSERCRCPDYAPVRLSAPAPPGAIVESTFVGVADGALVAGTAA